MATGIKRVITIETRQRTVIRLNSRRTAKIRCEFCADEVEMLSPENAAANFDISLREIFRGIENGSLHFIEINKDTIFICVNSLKPYK
jgi:hypothetical protein